MVDRAPDGRGADGGESAGRGYPGWGGVWEVGQLPKNISIFE